MVHGAMPLGDLIAEAKKAGCELQEALDQEWNDEYGNTYSPRYLINGDKQVQLVPTNDDDVIVGPEFTEYVWIRLGLTDKITW